MLSGRHPLGDPAFESIDRSRRPSAVARHILDFEPFEDSICAESHVLERGEVEAEGLHGLDVLSSEKGLDIFGEAWCLHRRCNLKVNPL
jgi:hypothetical protein